MKKRMGSWILMIAFVVILCLSWVSWFLLQPWADNTNYENRQKASMPELSQATYSSFPTAFAEYLEDRLPFRNELMTLNSAVDYYLFHRSTSDTVLLGKDNWLFYVSKGDGDPLGSYQGTNLLSEDELAVMAENCVFWRDYLAERGMEFVIFIPPNKERMYSEYMPDDYGTPAEENKIKQIVDYLRTHTDLRVVYPYEELMQAKELVSDPIYYRTDSHWNQIGAYVGTAALLKELGIDMPSLADEGITIEASGKAAGDLAKMLYLSRPMKNVDNNYAVTGFDDHGVTTDSYDFYGMISCFTTDAADERSLYMIRDSFGSAMVSFLASQFDTTNMRHLTSYTNDDLWQCDPDIVVLELVERNADTLMQFALE